MPENSIYLDNAATSFPKPECVYEAMDRYNRESGVAVGRGAYRQAIEVQGEVDRCRQRLAQLLNAENPQRIIFTFNGTDSLNLAIQGVLRQGDHVITSVIEHNSVLRPLHELEREGRIELTLVPVDQAGVVNPDDFRQALRPHTRLLALTHASNVTGAIQPCADVGQIARAAGAVYLVDAAQTVGHVPIDVRALSADLVAAPGHKALMGPLGTGFIYIKPGIEQDLRSVRQGGTGTRSEVEFQPSTLPDKYEAGNHNAPGLIGLSAALKWRMEQPPAAVQAHEQKLLEHLLHGLEAIPGIEIHGPPTVAGRVGVVSISLGDQDPQIVATLLDQVAQVQVRSGLHCAPGAHRALGTLDRGGTVRFSVGAFTTQQELDIALDALRQVAENLN